MLTWQQRLLLSTGFEKNVQAHLAAVSFEDKNTLFRLGMQIRLVDAPYKLYQTHGLRMEAATIFNNLTPTVAIRVQIKASCARPS